MKAVLAVIVGVVIGGAVNMGLIIVGPEVIPLPEGVDPTNMESLKEAMPNFEPKHFVFPFLAHALGTLVGAVVAVLLSGGKSGFAYFVGVFFLLGGIANAAMLPAPTWFVAVDVVVAYIPMAIIAARLVGKSGGGD